MPTILDYLRHGEPEGGSLYRGNRIDHPLSEKGWDQMRASTAPLQGWDRIISSPLQRCQAFAHWLAEQRGIEVEVRENLKEVGFGSWEGQTRAELLASRADEYHAFYADPVNCRPPGAESLDAFGTRVGDVFDQLIVDYPEQRLLVVAHAGVIRATLGHVTGAPAIAWYRAAVNNAGISRFVHDQHGAKLHCHNWLPSL